MKIDNSIISNLTQVLKMFKFVVFVTFIAMASAQINWKRKFVIDSVSVPGKSYEDLVANISLKPLALQVPQDVVDGLNTAIGFTKNSAGAYTVDCSHVLSLPAINIVVDGEFYQLQAGNGYVGTEGSNCVSYIESSGNHIWVLGRHFVQQNLQVLNQN